MEDTLEEKIIGIIKSFTFSARRKFHIDRIILPEHIFKQDLGIDSLDFVELTLAIEKELNIELDDEVVEKFKKLEQLIDYVKDVKKLKEKWMKIIQLI